MSNLLNPSRFESGEASFAGLDIFAIYGMQKTDLSPDNGLFIKIRRSDSVGNAYDVYFDDDGQFSDDSNTIDTTTASEALFGDIKSTHNWSIISFYEHINQNNALLANNGTTPGLAECCRGGTILTDPEHGLPAADFLGIRGFNKSGFVYSQMDSTNDFSVMCVANLTDANDQHDLWSTTISGTPYIKGIIDFSTNKKSAERVSTVSTYTNTFTSQPTTETQRRVLTRHEGSVGFSMGLTTHLNGTLQDTDLTSGTHSNTRLRIGSGNSISANACDGYMNLWIFMSSFIDDTQIETLESAVIGIYGV